MINLRNTVGDLVMQQENRNTKCFVSTGNKTVYLTDQTFVDEEGNDYSTSPYDDIDHEDPDFGISPETIQIYTKQKRDVPTSQKQPRSNIKFKSAHTKKENSLKDFLYILSELSSYKTPTEVANSECITHLNIYSDMAKILILRALIYNENLRNSFYLGDQVLDKVINKLLTGNQKLNKPMKQPQDQNILHHTCDDDTLMHCAGKQGYHRLVAQLFYHGCSSSLVIPNKNKFTPYDSTINQIARITYDNSLSEKDKSLLLFHLELTKDTLSQMPDRVTLAAMPQIKDALKDLKSENATLFGIMKETANNSGVPGAGLVVGLFRVLELLWHYKKTPPKEITQSANEKTAIQKEPIDESQELGESILQSIFSSYTKSNWIPYGCPSTGTIKYMDKLHHTYQRTRES